jgi:hypothetical protein
MITILSMLSIIALCFAVLSLSVTGLWPYYIPVALIAALLWMHGIDLRNRCVARRIVRLFPELLSVQEQEMLLGSPSLFVPSLGLHHPIFSGHDVTSVVQTAAAIGIAFGIISALKQAWIPACLALCIFLYCLRGPLANAFESHDPSDCMARAVDRCRSRLRRENRVVENEPGHRFDDMDFCYSTILSNLGSVRTLLEGSSERKLEALQIPRWVSGSAEPFMLRRPPVAMKPSSSRAS